MRGIVPANTSIMSPGVAIAPILRIAIQLTSATLRYCVSQGCSTEDFENAYHRYRKDLEDITADPDEISAGMSLYIGAPEGGTITVTDFTGSFELRKLMFRLSRAPAGRTEDVDVMTFHFLKVTSGTPSAWSDATDLGNVETAMNTWVTANKGSWFAFTHADQYRWYADGPAFYSLNGDGTAYVPNGDNPALRITEIDVAGTATGTSCLPPQCAVTVTEKTSSRKHWGRFYIPVQASATTDATGLVQSGQVTGFASSTVTLYNTCRAASVVPVVWSIQKPVRPKRPSGTLPAQPAKAYEITAVQVDDIVDIIRSRRYRTGLNKTTTALT